MPFELFIAGRYLRAKRKQAFVSLIASLSVIGVILGVMALVVVIAVMAGAQSDFRKRILGMEPHVLLMARGGISDYQEVERILSERKVAAATAPFVYGKVILRSSGGMSGVFLRGIEPEKQQLDVQNLEAGRLVLSKASESDTGLPGILLGKELASDLKVLPGDAVQVLSSEFILSPVGMVPKTRRFEVTGVFSSRLYEYDSALAYVHMEEASRLMGMGGAVTGVGIWIDDVYKAEEKGQEIQALFGDGYWTRNWIEMNKTLFAALELEKTALFIILALIILVAAFNIASSLIMMVMEKKKDIAILMAMGATRKLIRRIFVLQGMIIGVLGTGIGVFLGVALCLFLEHYPIIKLPEAYPFKTLPMQLAWLDVLIIGLSSLLICFFSTIYPARKASGLDPVEGIRYG